MTEPLIQVQQLTKVFRDFWHRPRVTAVRDVDFEVRRGEIFGLLGPNGSGKSTTIKLLLGLLHPSRGRIAVLGKSPSDVQVKKRLGYLPENSYIYPYLTSWETLDFYGRLFDLNRAERSRRIAQLLDMIGLQQARNRIVGEFSKGMTRRIGVAQALINDPDLIILDEPTSGLDPLGCRQMKDLLLTLARRGKTILMTSHLLADVEDLCDRVAILYNGRIRAMGTLDALLEETGRYRMTFPEGYDLASIEAIQTRVEQESGTPPLVDHPRRDLEQIFLDVVEKARNAETDASGVGADHGVAEYLARPQEPPTPTGPVSRSEVDARLTSLLAHVDKQAAPDDSGSDTP
ncbi:MAG: ABC transporter ATP-binding protein [Kiritimatiellae bacterium]|nr:ABC transporter ATP-binding protein [Kiritimatiellia bacterium]